MHQNKSGRTTTAIDRHTEQRPICKPNSENGIPELQCFLIADLGIEKSLPGLQMLEGGVKMTDMKMTDHRNVEA